MEDQQKQDGPREGRQPNGKHVGVVACSAEGAALCYRTICLESESRLGPYRHPEITMHTVCLGDYMDRFKAGDWDGVADLMIRSAGILNRCGAEFCVCPDNTIHQPFERIRRESPLPWLHIAEEAGREAQTRSLKRLLITGTRYLMTGPVYPESLRVFGVETIVPDPDERETIHRIIFEELVRGRIESVSRDRMNRIIERHALENGCDGVVLGCTEIPLLIQEENSPLPVLDSTRILARAAIRKALD